MADFGYKIDFARDTEDPERVFRAMLGLIEFSKVTDNTLIKYLDVEIESTLVLENIEQGSFIVWFKNILNPVDPNQKINVKSICSYLGRGKLDIIKFMNDRNTINNRSEILELQEILKESPPETESNPLGIYTAPSDKELLSNIDKFCKASSELKKSDQLFYLIKKSTFPVNRHFYLSEESKEKLLFKEVIENELTMILKVKKPDYLGESKWEFKHEKRRIEAKIADLEWLQSFRNGDVFIFPRASIKAIVKIVSKYDHGGKLISSQYTIKKVIEVIPPSPPPGTQLSLFPDE
ncbi:MAG: hypothetical protein F6K23_09015 [Okeania sp. SIO2C9]|uniref:hypothetical protein n=1 Tax=Okeania sp. SIO2C9 TaxID=2607791 RepID=UPI0013C0FDE1|nr:hypothetical protein [Okeania sp. SIO2C9]NEQ73203.1 hypothetical protein [Okeania sp. SIO2C9]